MDNNVCWMSSQRDKGDKSFFRELTSQCDFDLSQTNLACAYCRLEGQFFCQKELNPAYQQYQVANGTITLSPFNKMSEIAAYVERSYPQLTPIGVVQLLNHMFGFIARAESQPQMYYPYGEAWRRAASTDNCCHIL